VYTQINLDLDAAITLLSDAVTRRAKSHFNVNVAKGMKARVALTTQDWTTAATNAAEARQTFTLMTNAQYLTGFNDITNSEWMWGSDQLSDQQTFFHSFFAFMSGNFNSTNIRTNPKAINSALYDPVPATDVRKGLWDPTGTNTQFPVPPSGVRKAYMTRKFLAESSSSSVGDVPYMRMAEMYLIEAEARAQLSQDAAAATVLHTLVNNRNPASTMSVNTGQALIDEIRIQRRLELWGEGFRFLDLKRTNSALNRTGANHTQSLCRIFSVPAGDIQWEYLIPRDELNTNPMQQNPL
jgi:starch-binding outer membrane protein, SusD/RagB family